MSLKEELDEKVRQYRLKQHSALQKEKEEKQKEVQEVQHRRHQEKIKKIAMKDAQYIWKRLEKLFLSSQKNDESLTFTVCFCERTRSIDDSFGYAPHRVFVSYDDLPVRCYLLARRKIRYSQETSVFLQQIAKDEGLTVCNHGYHSRYHLSEILAFNMGCIYGDWISFTYNAPSVKED